MRRAPARSIPLASLFLVAGFLGCERPEHPPAAPILGRAIEVTADAPVHAPEPPSQTPPALLPEAAPDPSRRALSHWVGDPSGSGVARSAAAHRAKDETVKALFDAAEVPFPPAEVLFRVFKQERELEVWAAGESGGSMAKVATYEICAMSGGPGPKRREGDLQVPEGFYRIAYFWPDSAFYLAANVGYPNVSDRLLGGAHPGSDIMIHGGCASIGCMAMTDERIQELYVMGTAAQFRGKPVHVHIFPARDLGPLLDDPAHAKHHGFWRDIAPALDLFAADPRLPRVSIEPRGRYVVRPPS